MSYRNDETDLTGAEAWIGHPVHAGYSVSSDGRVRGIKGGILAPETIAGGYQRVYVGCRKQLIHILVAELFIGPKPAGLQVNHRDGVTSHNAASNLEYSTPSQNVRHSLDVLGRQRARGSKNGASRLTEQQVAEIRSQFAVGDVTQTALAARFGVARSTIGRLLSGKYWPTSNEETS